LDHDTGIFDRWFQYIENKFGTQLEHEDPIYKLQNALRELLNGWNSQRCTTESASRVIEVATEWQVKVPPEPRTTTSTVVVAPGIEGVPSGSSGLSDGIVRGGSVAFIAYAIARGFRGGGGVLGFK
jgi:hypothetical protein